LLHDNIRVSGDCRPDEARAIENVDDNWFDSSGAQARGSGWRTSRAEDLETCLQ
jgi:hypothetical protein